MTEHKGTKNAILNFPAELRALSIHFLKKRATMDIIILITTIVVIGKYIFRLGRSMTISPGSRPMGNFPSQGQKRPTARNTTPKRINDFCMTIYTIVRNKRTYSWDNSCNIPFTKLPSASLPKCFIMGAMACIELLY